MRILLLFCGLSIGLSLTAQDEEVVYSADGHPVITFKNQTIDLGEITEGEEVTMQFDFINSGSDPLAIEIVTACKCTSLSWPEKPVMPNGKASIFVKFDSTGYNGEVSKVVDIISNTDPVVVEAFFKATVVRAK